MLWAIDVRLYHWDTTLATHRHEAGVYHAARAQLPSTRPVLAANGMASLSITLTLTRRRRWLYQCTLCLKRKTQRPRPRPYDHVVRCRIWKHAPVLGMSAYGIQNSCPSGLGLDIRASDKRRPSRHQTVEYGGLVRRLRAGLRPSVHQDTHHLGAHPPRLTWVERCG